MPRARIRVRAEQRHIGYVFQDARLFPHYSRARQPAIRRTRVRSAPSTPACFDDVVALLGLEALLPRRPVALSGGESQRVALGRALLSQPRLLLLDEPLASLDSRAARKCCPTSSGCATSCRMPMIYVSHQFDEVLRLATHLVVMDNGRVSVASGDLAAVSLHPGAARHRRAGCGGRGDRGEGGAHR